MRGGRNDQTKARRTRALLIAFTAAGMMTAALGVPAAAAADVCSGLHSGKIDTTGDPQSASHTAPSGQMLTGYCVKAGPGNQGNGPEYVTLTTPVATLTITHSSGKAVSHYSFSYAARVATTTNTTTANVAPTTTTTPTTISCGVICGPARVTQTLPPPPTTETPGTTSSCGVICGRAAVATTPEPTTQPPQEEILTLATVPTSVTEPPTMILATGRSTPDPTTTQPTATTSDNSPTLPSSGSLPETGGSSLAVVAFAFWSLLAGLLMRFSTTRRQPAA
jgi:hypothetical protein